jgi:hypothetical protein
MNCCEKAGGRNKEKINTKTRFLFTEIPRGLTKGGIIEGLAGRCQPRYILEGSIVVL